MNNYRNISVLPTASDFSNRNQTHTLQANIPKGRFDGVVHYLNIHCNLLREDYIRQLREGIAEYKCSTRSNQKRLHKAGDVNIYFNIRIIDRVFETNGLYYEAEFDVTPFRNHHWEVNTIHFTVMIGGLFFSLCIKIIIYYFIDLSLVNSCFRDRSFVLLPINSKLSVLQQLLEEETSII